MNFARLAGLAACACLATAAQADVITLVSDPSALKATDTIDFSQLGNDGASLPQTTTITTTGGRQAGLAFASGGGTVCAPDSSGYGACGSSYASDSFNGDSAAFSHFAVLSESGASLYSPGSGTGPITITLPGVSAIGTNVLSDLAYQGAQGSGLPVPFVVSLSVYSGTTLLGTVSGTSDAAADPFYLGASDASGADITSAVFTLTQMGVPGTPDIPGTPAVYGTVPSAADVYYNPYVPHADLPSCAPLRSWQVDPQTTQGLLEILQCPRILDVFYPLHLSAAQISAVEALNGGTLPVSDPALSVNYTYPVVTPATPTIYGTPSTVDTDPSDLASLYLDRIDLVAPAAVVAAVPEPATCALFIGGLAAIGFVRRRRSAPLTTGPRGMA